MSILNLFFPKEVKEGQAKEREAKKVGSSGRFYNFSALPSISPDPILQNEILKLTREPQPNIENKTIIKQARNLEASNSLIAGYLSMSLSEVLGENGIKLDISGDNADLSRQIEDAFWDFKEQVGDFGDFWDIERLALTHYLRDGEAFVYIKEAKEGLDLQVLDPLDCDHAYTKPKAGIYNGIQFKDSAIQGYYFKGEREYRYIPKDNILHIFIRKTPRQIRGLSPLAPVIIPAHLNDTFKLAELKRARLQGEVTGFATVAKDYSEPDFLREEKKEDVKIEQVSVGRMQFIDEDLRFHFAPTHNPTNIEFFIKDNKREIAKALHFSYASLTGDLSDANYSSTRHGDIKERRATKSLQNFFIRKFHNRVFRIWVKNELINKRLDTAAAEYALRGFSFKAQGFEYIDPYKENNANAKALETGQKTLTEILASRGKEYDEHLAELKKDALLYELIGKNRAIADEIGNEED